ncbi:hypothetical protein VNO77_42344 [Canavalia gladiata]|uniref:Thiolase N-terminal domain-containing protein n=1 Tax=Canavalia gladiata TaxID=3824 RepID=A0AAN9PTB3_CANGL
MVLLATISPSTSNAPEHIIEVRKGSRSGHDIVIDGILKDGLWGVYNDFGMEVCAELCADHHVITKDEQDSYAIQSFERGTSAQKACHLAWETTLIEASNRMRKPSKLVDKDKARGRLVLRN